MSGRSVGAAWRLPTRVRLTLVYTLITIVSMVALFALTIFTLYRTLQQDDLRELQGRLLGYWAQYQTGGLELLQSDISVDNLLPGERPFAVRIADRTNATLYYTYPQLWTPFNIDRLAVLDLDPRQVHILSAADQEYDLEVAGIWLSDDHFLQLVLSTQNRNRLVALFRRNFVLIALAVLTVGVTAGLAVSQHALRPVSRVTDVARHIVETGRLDARVERATGGRELEELVDVINGMLGRLDRLVGGMRATVDMVAHDLRTPITRLRARAELALRDGSGVESEAALVETVEQSDEILRLVNTLLDITEAESGVVPLDRASVDLDAVAAEVCDLYELAAEEREVTLRRVAGSAAVVTGDRVRLRQAVANLVDNAVKYCRRGGTVTVSVTTGVRPEAAARATGASGDAVTVTVHDTGPGLAPEECERVWERMYRGPVQPSGERGLGLGLSLVKAVVEAHGGAVAVASQPGHGATFSCTIPAETPGG